MFEISNKTDRTGAFNISDFIKNDKIIFQYDGIRITGAVKAVDLARCRITALDMSGQSYSFSINQVIALF
jgi:hypothetical protein